MILGIIIGVVVLIFIGIFVIYNGLVTMCNRVKEAWSDIDVQLKRRHDLIPNLVETVKGYATHEKELFEKVTEDRAAAINATGPAAQAKAEDMLSNTLKSIFAVAENYPQLRASENFQQLQGELTDTENKIEASRRFYNGNVRDFNIKIEQFPSNIIAGMFGFKQAEFFALGEAEAKEAREPVNVKF